MDYWLGYIVRSSIVNGLINKFEKLIIILVGARVRFK